jgi:transposase
MTYSLDIVNLSLKYFKEGYGFKYISKLLKISSITLKRWNSIYNFSDICTVIKDRIKLKHKVLKIEKFKNIILEEVKINYKTSLKVLKKKVNNIISISTIHRLLKNENISYKRINNKLVFKSYEEIQTNRKEWANTVKLKTFRNGIHVDESSFCVGDLKKYGYSPKGKVIINTKHSRYREKYTLLLAISKDKIINYKIYKNSITSVDYSKFIKSLGNKKSIFQDNARIHHSLELKEYCKINRTKLIYNPPYTPEFNPIENVFSVIKNKFRNMNHDNVQNDIIDSIKSVKNSILRNCYTHAEKIIISYT